MPEAATCHVCGDAIVDATNSALCNSCDRPFHLRLRMDSDGNDCGDARINEDHLGLEFFCFACLGVSLGGDLAEPPVAQGH